MGDNIWDKFARKRKRGKETKPSPIVQEAGYHVEMLTEGVEACSCPTETSETLSWWQLQLCRNQCGKQEENLVLGTEYAFSEIIAKSKLRSILCYKREENPMTLLLALGQGSMALNVLTLSKTPCPFWAVICLCVSTWMCLWVCVCVSTSVYVSVYMNVWMCVWVCVYECVWVCVCCSNNNNWYPLWWLVFVNVTNWSHMGKGKLKEEIASIRSAYRHVCGAISSLMADMRGLSTFTRPSWCLSLGPLH